MSIRSIAATSNSVVVFESEVLPYVDDIHEVVAELGRVTGGDVFAVHLLGTRSGFPRRDGH